MAIGCQECFEACLFYCMGFVDDGVLGEDLNLLLDWFNYICSFACHDSCQGPAWYVPLANFCVCVVSAVTLAQLVALIPIDLNLAYLRRCLAHFDKDPVTQEKLCPTKCEIHDALSITRLLAWMTQTEYYHVTAAITNTSAAYSLQCSVSNWNRGYRLHLCLSSCSVQFYFTQLRAHHHALFPWHALVIIMMRADIGFHGD